MVKVGKSMKKNIYEEEEVVSISGSKLKRKLIFLEILFLSPTSCGNVFLFRSMLHTHTYTHNVDGDEGE